MSVQELLRTYALLGLPAGLAGGLMLSLPAWRGGADGTGHPGAWGGYGSFPRRAVRLAHVATVMLPVIAGVWSLLLADRSGPAAFWGARLWVAGGVALPLALAAAAFRRPLAPFLLPPPALALAAAAVLFAVEGLGGRP